MSTIPELLCAEFEAVLVREIGRVRCEEVLAANREEADPNVCHSHDHCDANEVMLEAFKNVVGRPMDLGSDDDWCLADRAWKLFRKLSVKE